MTRIERLSLVLCSTLLAALIAAPGVAQQALKFELKQTVIAYYSGPFCMDVENGSYSSGDNARVNGCDDRESQIWDVVSVPGSSYSMLVARHSGHCLDVKGASTRRGRNIQQYNCHGGDNQLWKLEPTGLGHYWIRNKNSDLCVTTVTAGFPKQRFILEQDDCTNSDDRLWEQITSFCGNNYCGDFLENCTSCARDCGVCPPPPPVCGDWVCEAGETCSSCATDCGACPSCPNGLCEPGESCSTCSDCGPCPTCGNGVCELSEDCNTCPSDCPSLSGPFEEDECAFQ